MSNLLLRQRTALLALLLFATGQTVLAQQASHHLTFDVTAATENSDQELFSHAMDELRTQLSAKGALQSKTPDWSFLVGAAEVRQDGADGVVLSVVMMHRLPEQAIQVGKVAEVFYTRMSDERRAAIPAEGKFIREQISEDLLRQFGTVQDHEMVVVNRSDLETGVAEVVGRFNARHTRP